MTFSQAKIDAYAQLDAAIDNLREVYQTEDQDGDHDPDVLKGWVLLTGTVKFRDPDSDDPMADDVDLTSRVGWYEKRGQDPVYSYGIVHDAIRHYNELQASE